MNSRPRVLVTGATGQLGQELARLTQATPELDWRFVDRTTLNLADTHQIAATLASIAPQIIINCAAYTAVDKAESEPEMADAINHRAVAAMASAAKALDACMIQVSTDYVFNGMHHRPYKPTDSPSPQGVYGASKLAGEQAFIRSGVRGIVLRTSWVYSAWGKNFVGTMLRLGAQRDSLSVVADQIGCPTWAKDLAQALVDICCSEKLQSTRGGIYHFSNAGVCSWFDLASCIMHERSLSCRITPITSEDYPTPAKRPHFSVLDCQSTLDDFTVVAPHWLHSLRLALKEFTPSPP